MLIFCDICVHINSRHRSISEHATVIGTTMYMSPQVMMGSDGETGYGRKADIWSLGITLCEMATGRSPYKNAPSAIYSVCVTKEYPEFPSHMTDDAHLFLSRYMVTVLCIVGKLNTIYILQYNSSVAHFIHLLFIFCLVPFKYIFSN